MEDEAEVVSAHFVAFSVAESFRVFAEEAVRSAGGSVKQANGVEQGGFTGSGGADDGEEFAAFHHQVETVEDGSVAPLKDAGNAAHFDGGRSVGIGVRRDVRHSVEPGSFSPTLRGCHVVGGSLGDSMMAAHETSTFCPVLRFALIAAYPPAVRRTSTLTRSVAGASLLVEVELPPFSTST